MGPRGAGDGCFYAFFFECSLLATSPYIYIGDAPQEGVCNKNAMHFLLLSAHHCIAKEGGGGNLRCFAAKHGGLRSMGKKQALARGGGRTGYLLNDKNRFEDMIHTPSPMLRTVG